MNPRDYRFVPVSRADYPMLRRWLSHPHIAGWWGPPETEIPLIEEDIDQGPTDMRIVWLKNQPFAYVQDYPAHHWPAPQFCDLPIGARAMDTFLGEPAFLGQRHASGYLRQRANELVTNGAACVAVDPDPTNTRAIATYEKAGFAGTRILNCGDGAKVRVMIFES